MSSDEDDVFLVSVVPKFAGLGTMVVSTKLAVVNLPAEDFDDDDELPPPSSVIDVTGVLWSVESELEIDSDRLVFESEFRTGPKSFFCSK